MKFPEKLYPYLSKLEKMEFGIPKEDSWLFRRDYKEELFKEYNHRLNLIEHRQLVLGGDKGVHITK
jgi:hypothetical protein